MITSDGGSEALADTQFHWRPAETLAAIIGERDTESVREVVS